MSDSPESVVRDFIASWEDASIEKLVGFLSADAVYTDPTRGVHTGLDAIKRLFKGYLQTTPSTTVDIKSIASNGGTVMVERVDSFTLEGKPFSVEAVGVFEVAGDGLINRFRDYYDDKSIADQLKAAGISIHS